MEIEAEPELEYFNCIFYVKKTDEANKTLCKVCLTDETEDGNQWDRYQLRCGHIYHTRCFRRWCGVKNCLNCPYCGTIEEAKKNRYCDDCDAYGHNVLCDGMYACPRVRRSMLKQR